MYQRVLPQAVLVTLKGFVSRVDALVRRQQRAEPELFGTEPAAVRLLPRVAALVLLQFARMLEACRAVAAAVGPLLGVTQHVDFEVPPPGAGLATAHM